MRQQLWLIIILSVALAACAPGQDEQEKTAAVALEGQGGETGESAETELLSSGVAGKSLEVPKECPVTLGQATPFVPPETYPAKAPGSENWYGSKALWTALPPDGVWRGLPWSGDGYTQKIFWWRDGYRWSHEPEPALTVTGRRLDGPAPPLESLPATNAFAPDIRSAMLVGVSLPTTGCWEITGRYGEAALGFVVWVTP